jgi:apolipoprotein N-acyltransferase
MLQVSDVGGAAAVTYVVALVNAALASSLGAYRDRRSRLRPLAVALSVMALVRLYGEMRLQQWAAPEGDRLRVALVQGNVPDAWRYSLPRLPDAVRRLAELTAETTPAEPALVVWPENAVSVAVTDNERMLAPVTSHLASAARLLVGAPRAETGAGSASLRNSAYLVDDRGRILDVYDKIRLTPYGESLPRVVGAFVGTAGAGEAYTPGERRTIFEVGGHRFAALICYEAIYAPLVREFVRGGAEFLVNISNDGWFGAQPSLEQHFIAVQQRAVESRRFLLRATNAGITAVIDPRGAVIATAPRDEATTLLATVVPIAEQTAYTRAGDAFGWACAVLTLALCLTPRRR